jgi:hypothetical protein
VSGIIREDDVPMRHMEVTAWKFMEGMRQNLRTVQIQQRRNKPKQRQALVAHV